MALTANARSVALEVLRRVFKDKAFASSTLRATFSAAEGLSAADRGLATELVYGVLRRRGLLDRALKKASGRRVKDLDPKLVDILRLGAYQLLYLDRVPDHAAVSTAVELAKAARGKRGGAFVNALLRKLASTPDAARMAPAPPLAADPTAHVAALGSVPHALAGRLVEDLGPETALAFVLASLEPAPLTLRANLLRTSAEDLARELGGEVGNLPCSVRLPAATGILPGDLPAVAEGRATPQDEASMHVVNLLDPQPGERMLDLCAAPGGKTTFAAERMRDEGEVWAHDRLPTRLARVEQSAKRLGLSSVRIAEALPGPQATFDRVLVDAPCSGLGTLRRHPEIRWRLTEDDLTSLRRTQAEVLAEGAARVAPGGTLVYSVCTITRGEGEGQLEALGDEFELQETLRTGPHQPGAPDGFFAAKLTRRG